MKTNPTYLVIGRGRNGKPSVRRAHERPPALFAGEITYRVSLEIPDDDWNRPTRVVEIPAGTESVLAVEAEPLP